MTSKIYVLLTLTTTTTKRTSSLLYNSHTVLDFVTIPSLRLRYTYLSIYTCRSIFYLDRRNNVKTGYGIHEKMLIDTSKTSGYVLYPDKEKTEVKQTCENDGSSPPCANGVRTVFEATTDGTGKDNPSDPNNLTEQQKSRSIVFSFEDTECWEFVYDAYCPFEPEQSCAWYGGSNFFFSGSAKEVVDEGECISPPQERDTPAPTTTPRDECKEDRKKRKLNGDYVSLKDTYALENSISTTFDEVTNTFTLTFDVNESIEQGNTVAAIYDQGCGEGGNDLNDNGITSIITTVIPESGRANLSFVLDTSVLALNPDVFTASNDDTTAEMKICSRFMLQTGDGGYEVNFNEAVITITFDLTAGFTVDAFAVEAKDKCVTLGEKEYGIEAYLCVPRYPYPEVTVTEANAFQQGSLISVCVTPDDPSIDDGIVLKEIENFKWTREDEDGSNYIEQVAVEDSRRASNLLTELNCQSGWSVCSFSSILFAEFYKTAGEVAGSGTATMQFDVDDATARQRRLDLDEGVQRTLQAAGDAPAATSDFDISIGVSTLDDGRGAIKTAGATTNTLGTTTTTTTSFLVGSALAFLLVDAIIFV